MTIDRIGPTLGAYVGIPLLVLGALITLALLAAVIVGDIDIKIPAGIFLVCALLIMGIGVAAYYPFGSEWHSNYRVTGTVQETNKRLIADGDSMSERYVLNIDGKPFGVDDTRASLVKPGDKVTLICNKEWQYAAEAGWACRWGGKG